MQNLKTEITTASLKVAPPWVVFGFTLNEIVAILAGFYTSIQIAFVIQKWIWESQDRKK